MTTRRGKITASIVGTIYNQKETTSPQNVVDLVMQNNAKDLSHIPAIKHGQKYESDAKQHYSTMCNVKVEERGLILHPQYEYRWLGASVDGFVCGEHNFCMEIKYPLLGLKDPVGASLLDLARCRKSWFLHVDYKSNLTLNVKHKYYLQCQIQMACTEVETCMFFTYLCSASGTYIDSHAQRVERDQQLIDKVIRKCHLFYKKKIEPLVR